MKITFLGTSAAVPTLKRNVSSVALQFDQKREWWLFDCGEGTQRQIAKAELSLFHLEKIFISHLHADHVLGVCPLLATRGLIGATSKVTVYGPVGITRLITDTFNGTKSGVPKSMLEIVELSNLFLDGCKNRLVNGEYSIDAFSVPHVHFTVAFVVTEIDRQGTFHADKAKGMGINPGPIYRRLKDGETVTLDDGRIVDGKTLVDPPRKGRKLAVVCDTSNAEAIIPAAMDCDAMIHEATYANADVALAVANGHSTAEQAGLLAKRLNSKALLMSHFSPRYDQRAEDGLCIDDLIREARAVFPSDVLAAKDFMQHEIR
jgi:ribonuclease Z